MGELNKLIIKTYCGGKQKRLLAVLLLGLSILVGFAANYMTCEKFNRLEDARALYGVYNAVIENIDPDTLIKISHEDSVNDYAVYRFEDFDYKNYSFILDIQPRAFDICNYVLTDGRMPDNDDELLCENKYLSYMGYASYKEVPELEINGRSYNVVGAYIERNDGIIIGVYNPIFIKKLGNNLNSGLYSVYLCLEDMDDISRIADKYGISEEQIGYNTNVLNYAGIDKDGGYISAWNRICAMFVAVMAAMSVFIIYRVAVIYLYKSRYDLYILMANGVSARRIAISITGFVCGGWLALWAALIAVIIIYNYIFVSVSGRSYSCLVSLGLLAGFAAAMAAAAAVFIFFRAFISMRKGINAGLSNRECAKKPLRRIKPSTDFVGYMGKSLTSAKRRQYAAYFLTIILSMAAVTAAGYVINEILRINDENGYDYRADYIFSTAGEMELGIPGMDEKYHEIESREDLFSVFPVYYVNERISLKKNLLSEEYIEYKRAQSTEWNIALSVIDERKYSDRAIIMGLDKTSMLTLGKEHFKGIDIPGENECIVVNAVRTENGNIDWGLSAGAELAFDYYDFNNRDEEGNPLEYTMSLKASAVIDSMDVSGEVFDDVTVILVNMDNFYKLVEYTYPQIVYIDRAGGTDVQVQDYFRGIGGIDLVDLNQEKSYIVSQRRRFFAMTALFAAGLMAVFAINLYIAMNESFETNRRPTAMLKIIGVDDRRLVKIHLRAYAKLYLYSAVFGNALSCAACYFIYWIIIQEGKIGGFRLPPGSFIAANIIVIAIFAGIALLVRRKIRSLTKGQSP